MFTYVWDRETKGYLLTNEIAQFLKEIRPVFFEELDALGFDRHWSYPRCESPLLWALTNTYIYDGEEVAKSLGGNYYERPAISIIKDSLTLEPVAIERMVEKNQELMNYLVNDAVLEIHKKYYDYKDFVHMVYVAYSGGKDSIVTLDLVNRALPNNEVKVVFGDTGMEFSDTHATYRSAVEKYSKMEFHKTESALPPLTTWKEFGPPSRSIRWCCSVHKTVPTLKLIDALVEKEQRNSNKSGEKKRYKVLCYDGVRHAESTARSRYEDVGIGQKHGQQINHHAIIKWNSAEVFLYIFGENLDMNPAYRKGLHRVGCFLCPKSNERFEYIKNYYYNIEVESFYSIVLNAVSDSPRFHNLKEGYLTQEFWKARKTGNELKNAQDLIVEEENRDSLIFYIKQEMPMFINWLKIVADVDFNHNKSYAIKYKGNRYNMLYEPDSNKTKITLLARKQGVADIRFFALFRAAVKKSVYCLGCQSCEVECRNNALKTEGGVLTWDEKACTRCEKCFDTDNPYWAYTSKKIAKESRNMFKNTYANFGFRTEFLKLLLRYEDKFSNGAEEINSPKRKAFLIWAKEAKLVDVKNRCTELFYQVKRLGTDSLSTWGLIAINLSYDSVYFRWYIQNMPLNIKKSNEELYDMFGEEIVLKTRQMVIAVLKDSFKNTLMGEELGLGDCEKKGNTVISITRKPWQTPTPLVVMYGLYRYAEKNGNIKDFSLKILFDSESCSTGISPALLFGIDKEKMVQILNHLYVNYSDYINVSFTHGLDNISLAKEKTADDAMRLIK